MKTIAQYCEKYEVKKDTARMRFNNLFSGTSFSVDRQISETDAAVLFAKEMKGGGAKSEDVPGESAREKQRERTGETQGKRARKIALPKFRVTKKALFCSLLFAAEISHGLMLVSEGFSLYGVAGLFATSAMFVAVLATLVISGDAEHARTSEMAVFACALIYAAAGRVHYEHFSQMRPEAYDINLGAAVLIPAIAFICLYLYRDVQLD